MYAYRRLLDSPGKRGFPQVCRIFKAWADALPREVVLPMLSVPVRLGGRDNTHGLEDGLELKLVAVIPDATVPTSGNSRLVVYDKSKKLVETVHRLEPLPPATLPHPLVSGRRQRAARAEPAPSDLARARQGTLVLHERGYQLVRRQLAPALAKLELDCWLVVDARFDDGHAFEIVAQKGKGAPGGPPAPPPRPTSGSLPAPRAAAKAVEKLFEWARLRVVDEVALLDPSADDAEEGAGGGDDEEMEEAPLTAEGVRELDFNTPS